MSERKIIFKARVGSHLHGTYTPKSDEDFLGVFLPSADDMPIYHPSYILRNSSAEVTVKSALEGLKAILEDWKKGRE